MVSKQEQLVRKHAVRLNPSLPVEYSALRQAATSPVIAWTNYRKVVVEMDESWRPEGSFLERKKEPDGLEAVCRDVVAHEVAGHNNSLYTQGCPGSVDLHAVMKHFVNNALRECGKTGLRYCTNAVQDVFANLIIHGVEGHTNAGLTLFYEPNVSGASRFYEAFVKLNLAVWGSLPDVTHLRKYFTQRDGVNEAWKNIVKELKLKLCDPAHNKMVLLNESLWNQQAYVIAKHLAPLLDDTVYENTCSHGNTPGETNNPFDEELEDPVVQRRVAKEFYDDKIGLPSFMPVTDALLRFYESLGEMPVVAQAETRSVGVNIVPYQWKDTLDASKADLTKLGMNAAGELTLREPTERLEIPFKYRTCKTDYPDSVIAVLDRSPSMLEPLDAGNNTRFVPWGDKSKWHYTLWSWFAVTNDLIKTNKIAYVRNNALLFATKTEEYGPTPGGGLDALRRWVLEHPPTNKGGTALDMNKIRKNCAGAPKVFISISDGEVSNWKNVRKEYLALTEPHAYVHLQIGAPSEMSADLLNNKRKVYPITTGMEMIELLRGIVAEVYA